MSPHESSVTEHLRWRAWRNLADIDPEGTPGIKGDRTDAEQSVADTSEELADLQERLFAASRAKAPRGSVVLLIQGMDTSGKGGIMRHVVGELDPQGIALTSFKAPTPEERSHDFLWRIRRALPAPGMIGVFDRSQYEDVLIVAVRNLVPAQEWQQRFALINDFEAECAANGIHFIKVMLHISKDEQKKRLLGRLEDPAKNWKYNPGDVDERALWDDYQKAYQRVLDKCSTSIAPWHVVPANHKWYARWAVHHLLLEHLRSLHLGWPAATFDVAAEKARVQAS